MALTKRTRFEVRRDNHTCRYCGQMAPDVKITIDHVVPVSLGGSDKPDNLVAACKDCNAGKASTSPTEEMVAQVGEDDIRWAEAVKRAADAMVEIQEEQAKRHQWFIDQWQEWDKKCVYLPNGWAKSMDHWLGAGLPESVLSDCLDIAVRNEKVKHGAVFAYMGGIARKKIEQLHEVAKRILDAEGDA